MSDDFFNDNYDDNDFEQEPQPSGNGLRQFAESQKKRADALEQRLAELEGQNKKALLADRLKASGVSNPEALGKYAELINPDEATDFLSAVKAAMGLGDTPNDAAPAGLSEEEAAALAAVSGEPAGTAPVTTGDAAANLSAIDNEADFWKAIRSA